MHTSMLENACGCVLLAAGESLRLGTPKQLLRLQGETLLHRAARLAVEAGLSPVCVVVGRDAGRMRTELENVPVWVEWNEAWQQGMSRSLRAGIVRLQTVEGLSHALVMVCDQVGLTAGHLQDLRAASSAQPDRIVATAYGGILGVPAVFPSSFFEALLNIDGDRGARGLLEALKSHVVACDFAPGMQDIDTIEDARNAGLLL